MSAQGWNKKYEEPRPPLSHETWSWLAALPDVSDGKPRWMEFRNADAIQGDCRLRVEVAPFASGDADRVRLSISRSCDAQSTDVEIIRSAFESGGKPAAFVRWTKMDITKEDQQRDLAVIRGLPLLKDFRPGVVRYRKTPLRTDAFRCQHSYAIVDAEATEVNGKRKYRCDVWRCEELPFGIAEVEFQVTDAATGQLLHQERWQAVACEPPPLPRAQWSPLP